ncbi:MAG: apolipoprotein N-acyltransferase [Cardiobacteriaceae bacterium]|nr:apolipoprotein N-acyltransferase [Cardiobacteriaceae bacterium]
MIWLKSQTQACTAFFAGLLMTFAFAPWGLWIIGVLALATLSWLWLTPNRQRPVRDGFCFGLGYFGGGLHWVYISLYHYGNAPLAFALATNALLIALLALYPALVGWLLKHLTRPNTYLRTLAIPFFWLSLEWVRSYAFTGFPWLSIGYSQTQAPLSGLAPLGGVWLVGLALMLISALLGLSVARRSLAIATNAILLMLILSALQNLRFHRTIGEPLSVALVQANIPQTTKFDPRHMAKNFAKHLALSENRPEQIIIWPETAITYFEETIRDTLLADLHQDFLKRRQTLISGIPTGYSERDEYYNAAIALGVGQGQYRKHHLLPFGEYLPQRAFFERFRNMVDIPLGDFSRGAARQEPLMGHGVPAGVSICFEAAFGRHIRQALPEAKYLVNLSNDGWFKGSIAYDQHLQMNQMRALEVQRDIARATNTGLTAIISAEGKIVAQLPRDEEGVLSGYVKQRFGSTPYVRYGEKIFLGLLALWGFGLLLMFGYQKRHKPFYAP